MGTMLKMTLLTLLCTLLGINIGLAAETSVVRIARLHIKADHLPQFTALVREEMEAALRVEPGVLAIYAVADKNDATRLTFFEIYTNEEAYQVHRKTPHFKKYIEGTRNMVLSRDLMEAVPVELRDKYNTQVRKD